jgi:hypothetical protein
MEGLLPTLSSSGAVPEPIRRLAEADAPGTNNGRGFYNYNEGDSSRWEELLRRHVWKMYEMTEGN